LAFGHSGYRPIQRPGEESTSDRRYPALEQALLDKDAHSICIMDQSVSFALVVSIVVAFLVGKVG